MARFKRLTAAEARTMTRGQILDRILAEQAYWFAGGRHNRDRDGYQEFSRIMYAAVNPGDGISDTLAYLQGVPGAGQYFDQCPDVPDAPTDQEGPAN